MGLHVRFSLAPGRGTRQRQILNFVHSLAKTSAASCEARKRPLAPYDPGLPMPAKMLARRLPQTWRTARGSRCAQSMPLTWQVPTLYVALAHEKSASYSTPTTPDGPARRTPYFQVLAPIPQANPFTLATEHKSARNCNSPAASFLPGSRSHAAPLYFPALSYKMSADALFRTSRRDGWLVAKNASANS